MTPTIVPWTNRVRQGKSLKAHWFDFCIFCRIHCVFALFNKSCQESARATGDLGLEEGLWGGCSNNELLHCFRARSLPWASLELSHFPPPLQPQESEICSAVWPGDSFLSVRRSQWFSAWRQGKWTNSIGTEWNLLGNEWLQASGKAQMRQAMQ